MVLGLVQHMPSPLIRAAYRMPFVARLGSRMLKSAAASGDAKVVTIRQGPLAGKKLNVDANTPHYYWIKGHDEPAVLNVMKQHVHLGSTVVDIGAHIGIETMMLCQWVGDEGTVISVEPDPVNFAALQSNIAINKITNAQLKPIALSNTCGKLHFIHGQGVMCRLIDDPNDPAINQQQLITVEVNTLDQLFHDNAIKIDFLKIDVEDFEVQVLRGATRFLDQQHPVLIIELHSHQSAKGCIQILNQVGYDIKLLDTPFSDVSEYLKAQSQTYSENSFERCHLLATFNDDESQKMEDA
jgi:FkbM family methyltransferase